MAGSHPVRRSKIVATLGPASVARIPQLIAAGVNVFRLNFSHVVDPKTQVPVIAAIRKASQDLGVPVAILGDLGGPKVRCNEFKGRSSIPLVQGQTVRLVASEEQGDLGVITTSVAILVQQLEPGNRVLLDDGNMALQMTSRVSPTEVDMLVLVGGELKPHKGMNVPELRLDIPALTEKDRRDAAFIWEQQLEFIALSFVQIPEDIHDLLNLFKMFRQPLNRSSISLREDPEEEFPSTPWRPQIIAKIEKPQALDCIDAIIAAADGIMVARGDLGVEVSLERVPLIQKLLIRKANAAEKPVITATQMLESMINSPTPTRAEVSDVANAVMDGTDAVMLSGECAMGQYPIEAVKMMASVCERAESGDDYMWPPPVTNWQSSSTAVKRKVLGHPIANASVAAARESNAAAIVVFTHTGVMAHFISKRRPNRPIVAVTDRDYLYRRLSLLYGVYPMLSTATLTGNTEQVEKGTTAVTTDTLYAHTIKDIELQGLSERLGLLPGDPIVFCAGYHGPWPALSYSIKMFKI